MGLLRLLTIRSFLLRNKHRMTAISMGLNFVHFQNLSRVAKKMINEILNNLVLARGKFWEIMNSIERLLKY
ncbi:hypothetical protein BpHYR1_054098 [Brachionus plicatilis]|uniref:Uncharacterized protein n=1 Tax=Brachionus plicatilis TaxID=10195 RepID=A0A3M7RY00_BRAPC|nr:hypothetical protein BpHYR1_054098 [Brachionus plicatilis]